MTPSTTIHWGEFQVDNSVWKCVLCTGRPRKLVPDSGLRMQTEVGWRLVSDSCLGNLKGKRKAKLTALVMALSWLGMNEFSYGPCRTVIFDISNRPSAEPRRPQPKGSAHIMPSAQVLRRGQQVNSQDGNASARVKGHSRNLWLSHGDVNPRENQLLTPGKPREHRANQVSKNCSVSSASPSASEAMVE